MPRINNNDTMDTPARKSISPTSVTKTAQDTSLRLLSIMELIECNGKLISPVKNSVKKYYSGETWSKLLGRRKSFDGNPEIIITSSTNSSISESENEDINELFIRAESRGEFFEIRPENQQINANSDEKTEKLTYKHFEATLRDRGYDTNSSEENLSTLETRQSSENSESSDISAYDIACALPNTEKTNMLRHEFMEKAKKLIVKNIYDVEIGKDLPPHVDTRNKFIMEKFIVNMNRTPRSRRRCAPLHTPICDSMNRVKMSETVNKYTLDWERSLLVEKKNNEDPVTCGSNTELDISFSSSFGSDDSISDLISDDEDVSDKTFNVTDVDKHFEFFDYLRRKRNEECKAIREITKVLRCLRKNPTKNVDDILRAERGLLLSTERCTNFMTNMTNPEFGLIPKVPLTIHVSNIKIPLISTFDNSPNTYYVCIISSGITRFATNYIQPVGAEDDKYLLFEDEFMFDNLDDDFSIEIKVYYIELNNIKQRRDDKEILNPLPVKVYYDKHVTATSVKNEFLKPAFKQCGMFVILKETCCKTLKNYCPNQRFQKLASVDWMVSKISFNSDGKKKGYLFFGQRHAVTTLIEWNSKYVVLDETELRIYNYPSEQDKEPILKLDLKDVASEIVAHSCHLKYCMQLDIVYANWEFGEAFRFPYYFRADTWGDFKNWIQKLTFVINLHKRWRLLPYINCRKHS